MIDWFLLILCKIKRDKNIYLLNSVSQTQTDYFEMTPNFDLNQQKKIRFIVNVNLLII